MAASVQFALKSPILGFFLLKTGREWIVPAKRRTLLFPRFLLGKRDT
jgi:hypothetical protein